MSKLAKTLTVKKGSVAQNVPFYTTISEANQYGDYGTAIVDGVTAYYPLGAADSADTGSSHKTNMDCIKNGKNLYFLTKGNGELPSYNLILSATSNQTITLKYKNRNYKDTGYESEITKTSTSSAQTFSIRKGTTWTATVKRAEGYDAGTLSASSGTATENTTINASKATLQILTDDYHRMDRVYSSTYRTITTIPQFDTSNLTDMHNMFYGCTSLTSIPKLNTNKVTNMREMFWGTKLTTVPQLNTSKVTDMTRMFESCKSLQSTFPWAIDCSSITFFDQIRLMFENSSVTKVTLKNVNSSVKSKVNSKLLKGDNTLTITFA